MYSRAAGFVIETKKREPPAFLFCIHSSGSGWQLASTPLHLYFYSRLRSLKISAGMGRLELPPLARYASETYAPFKALWARGDSNSQGLLHTLLRRTRIPIPPRAHNGLKVNFRQFRHMPDVEYCSFIGDKKKRAGLKVRLAQ